MSLEENQQKPVCIPPLLQCPISLEIMSDPVTLCTGITYDRASIKKWFRAGNNICPASGQTLHTRDLIPNHTLAALIQKWRLTNPSERLDPAAEENEKLLQHMITQINKGGACKIEAIRNLRSLASDESNRLHLQSVGVLPALIRVVQCFDPVHPVEEEAEAVQEAIAAIVLFSEDDEICSKDLSRVPAIRTVEWVLVNGDLESKINAAILVEKLAKADETAAAEVGSMEGITEGLLTLFQQHNTLHSALRALVPLCRVVAYRVKLAETVGVIPLLIRFLSASEKAVLEASMAILERISSVYYGRWGIMAHAPALPTIVTSLLIVSPVATAHGLGILLNICKNCTTEDEIIAVVRTGVLEKLVALLHSQEPKNVLTFLSKFSHPSKSMIPVLSL